MATAEVQLNRVTRQVSRLEDLAASFFTVTLDRPELARHLEREPRKMPAVLSPEDVARLLEAAPGPKYKATLSTAYAAVLRVSEVVAR